MPTKSAKAKASAAPSSPIRDGGRAPHPLNARVGDNLVNLVTGMGTSKDKGTATQFAFVALDRAQAEAAYRGDWMSRKVIDIPAYDATREWRTWQSDSADITKLTDLENALGIQRKTMAVLQKARLYGGAALVLGVNQGRPEEPIDFEALGKDCLQFVHCVNRHEITAGQTDWDIMSPYFGQPKEYTRQVDGTTPMVLHPSRVIRFVGAEIPDINTAQGWGDSILQIVQDAIISTGTVFQSMTSLVQEAKVDIVKIPGLSEQISNAEYEAMLKTRFALAALMKSIYSVLIIDKEEEWTRVNQAFNGMPEIMREFLLLVCGAADIPATRFLGMSPAGMNSTGDSDTRNYYDRVATEQKIEITPRLESLDTLLQISALGKAPAGMHYNWNPLWQMSENEKADIAVKQATVMTADVNAGLMDPMVLQHARENQLIESGFYPGIEEIIDEYGTDIDEREPEVDPNAAALIDPETGQAPDPADPEAVARSKPDPSAAPSNVVPFGKKPKKGAPPAKGKKAAAGDGVLSSMAARIRDATLTEDTSTPRTLFISRAVKNWRAIRAFYEEQGVANVKSEDMHVTICYSKKPVDWLDVREDAWGNQDEKGNLTVRAGGPRVNEQFGKYFVLAFANSDLAYRHSSILERTEGTWEYDDYTPHVSISKEPGAVDPLTTKAWTGPIELGPEIFEEIQVDGALYEGGIYNAPPELARTEDAVDSAKLLTAMVDAIRAMPPPVINVTVPKVKRTESIKIQHDDKGRATGAVKTITETEE
jgi:phage-related protein (TIGR01555 family)